MKITIKNIKNKIYNIFFKSLPSKIIFIIGMLTILSALYTPTEESIPLIFITILFSASMANCVHCGGCLITSWLYISIPTITLLTIFLNHFKHLKYLNIQIKYITKQIKVYFKFNNTLIY